MYVLVPSFLPPPTSRNYDFNKLELKLHVDIYFSAKVSVQLFWLSHKEFQRS